MDLWADTPIDPFKINLANGFAESTNWLPGRDSLDVIGRHGG